MTPALITTIPRSSVESADIERPRDEESARRFDTALARAAAQSSHVRSVIRAPHEGAGDETVNDRADRTSLVGETGNQIAERAHERIAQEGSLTPIAQHASQQLTEAVGRSPAAEQPTTIAQPKQQTAQHQQRVEQPVAPAARPEQLTTQAQPQTGTQAAQTAAPTTEVAPPTQSGQADASQAAAEQHAGTGARQQSGTGQQHQQPHSKPAAITATRSSAKPGTPQNLNAFSSSLRRAAQMTRSRVAAPAQKTPFQLEQSKLEAQAARGLAAALKQRGGVVTMRLNPSSLGTLKVQVKMKNGVVDAKFEASTTQARQLLESNLTSLRAALESRGLTVERLSIAEPPAQDVSDRGIVGDDRGSEDHQAEDRPSHHAGEKGAGRATPGSHATDGEHAPDDPAHLAHGAREQHESVGGAGIAIRIDTVI